MRMSSDGDVRACSRARRRPPASPSAASATTVMSGSVSTILRRPAADERLVVGEQDADHGAAPASGSRARTA